MEVSELQRKKAEEERTRREGLRIDSGRVQLEGVVEGEEAVDTMRVVSQRERQMEMNKRVNRIYWDSIRQVWEGGVQVRGNEDCLDEMGMVVCRWVSEGGGKVMENSTKAGQED